jgi:hypothetical protein
MRYLPFIAPHGAPLMKHAWPDEFKPISPDRNAIVIVLPLRCDLGLRIDPTQCEK